MSALPFTSPCCSFPTTPNRARYQESYELHQIEEQAAFTFDPILELQLLPARTTPPPRPGPGYCESKYQLMLASGKILT